MPVKQNQTPHLFCGTYARGCAIFRAGFYQCLVDMDDTNDETQRRKTRCLLCECTDVWRCMILCAGFHQGLVELGETNDQNN